MSAKNNDRNDAFAVQTNVRGPWRKYLDELAPIRPDLHRYCRKLTGNVWDGEDLLQDALIKVFSLLGKIDADLSHPRAYLIRTVTNLWIDRQRRFAREFAHMELERRAEPGAVADSSMGKEVDEAVSSLMQNLHPQERAAVVMKDVLDLSLDETASILKTTVGAVKSALKRGRGRLDDLKKKAHFSAPSREMVQRFTDALANTDLDTLREICESHVTVELVGGAEIDSFDDSSTFFEHAHFVWPEAGFGENPRWEVAEYEGETLVLGFRTMNGVEGLNEVHRLEVLDGKITRIRCYCWCPDTLRTVGKHFGVDKVEHPLRTYRSPSPPGKD